MKTFRRATVVVVVLCCLPWTVSSQILSYTTKNLRLLYLDVAQGFVVPHIARSFENSLRFHRQLFAYTPSEPVTVLLHDFNDYGTGGTNTIPWNYLSIGIEPYDYAYETSPTNERFNWVMNHELVHVLATDKAAGADRVFRSLFLGKVEPVTSTPLTMFYSWLTSPRWYSPRWYHEGIAVFMETWMAGGIGRALGAYDEMVFRTMVRDSSMFYDYVGLESEGTTIDFQIGANSYLYGTRFLSYLADRHGPDALLRWVNRSEESRRSFSGQFEQVYGQPLADAWEEWVRWEHTWQQENLDSVRQYPLTPYTPVVAEPLGSVSRAFYDSATASLLLGMNLPGQLAQLVSVNIHTGEITRLCDILSPALYYVCSLAFDPATRLLFYTTHNSSSWRDINVLDLTTGEHHVALRNARIGDLAINRRDHALWGIQHHNGYSTLVKISAPYERWTDVLELKYGRDLYDIDVSPDGQFLSASMAEVSGRQRLVRFSIDSLMRGNPAYDVLHEFQDNAPMNFVFAPDGGSLYGTTYQTGVSNVVRCTPSQGTMEWLTNTETGFFRPLPFTADSLMVFRYTGKGFLPVLIAEHATDSVSAIRYLGQQVVEHHPVVTTWKLDPPSRISLDSLHPQEGTYNELGAMSLASLYPVLEGYKVYSSVGVRINLQDPLALSTFSLTGSVTPQHGLAGNERGHVRADFRYWQWHVTAAYNPADFYDLVGPTRTSRKGYSAGIEYRDYLFFERPQTLEYSLGMMGYWGLERLPEYQNVATAVDRFAIARGYLKYSFMRRSLGAVDDEQGIFALLSVDATVQQTTSPPRFLGALEYGWILPWDHTSLWLRTSAGFSPGEATDPASQFYFGGFGNNILDYREVRRYREPESFPGIPLNAIGGTNFGKMLVELDLPPLRFRECGLPWLYCTWARSSFFFGGVALGLDAPTPEHRAALAGVQVDLKLVLFSSLSSTLSFGYATAAEQGGRRQEEFMISLKLL